MPPGVATQPAGERRGWLGLPRKLWFVAGGVALLAIFFLVVGGKQRSMVAAHQGLEKVRWDNLDWTPPKLVLSSLRKPGKVCEDLTPLEAAFYLGIPFKRIVSGMLDSMVAEGLDVVDRDRRCGSSRVLSAPDTAGSGHVRAALLPVAGRRRGAVAGRARGADEPGGDHDPAEGLGRGHRGDQEPLRHVDRGLGAEQRAGELPAGAGPGAPITPGTAGTTRPTPTIGRGTATIATRTVTRPTFPSSPTTWSRHRSTPPWPWTSRCATTPATRPVTRPATRPVTRPATRPVTRPASAEAPTDGRAAPCGRAWPGSTSSSTTCGPSLRPERGPAADQAAQPGAEAQPDGRADPEDVCSTARPSTRCSTRWASDPERVGAGRASSCARCAAAWRETLDENRHLMRRRGAAVPHALLASCRPLRGRADLPLQPPLHRSATPGCNCTTNPAGDDREMTAARDPRRCCDKIRQQAKVPSVSFTGGEPTLRPDLPELVRHAKQLGLRVNLITNGTRVDAPMARPARRRRAGLGAGQPRGSRRRDPRRDHRLQRLVRHDRGRGGPPRPRPASGCTPTPRFAGRNLDECGADARLRAGAARPPSGSA